MPIQGRSGARSGFALTFVAVLLACETEPVPTGVWHLRNGGAVNLDIKADGTFVWNSDSCDSGSAGEGRWRTDWGDGIVLEPAERTRWPGGSSIFMESQVLRVSWQGDAIVITNTVKEPDTWAPPGQEPSRPKFPQTWERGTVCAQCGDRSVKVVPCNEPVTTRTKAHF